jgi:signal transduction histidine kinase
VETRSEEETHLGIAGATADQYLQIQEWTTGFRKMTVQVETASEIGAEPYTLYLLVIGAMPEDMTELQAMIAQMGRTPCIVLAAQDDDELVDAVLTAGAVTFLPWATLDAMLLERTVRFAIQRHQAHENLAVRENCLSAERERERLHLANVLHDGPLQDLIGARFLLGALEQNDSIATIQNNLQSVVHSVRALCSELKPPALGPFGLEKAIRAHIQGFQSLHPDLQVTLDLDADQQQLPEWVRMALFRIYQALLENVSQHSQATHVWIRLRLDESLVRLTVADDGQGFIVPDSWLEFGRTNRCGLLMIQERVDAIKGRMMVQSTPGSGVRVMIQAPLRQPSRPF